MEAVILTTNSATTVNGSATNPVQGKSGFDGPARSIVLTSTGVGAIAGTVNVYQVLQRSIKRLVASFTVAQSSGVQAVDIICAGQSFIADWIPTANPSGDTVTVVVEG